MTMAKSREAETGVGGFVACDDVLMNGGRVTLLSWTLGIGEHLISCDTTLAACVGRTTEKEGTHRRAAI